MKTVTMSLMLLLAAALLGCGEQQQPRHIVILPDVSGSIDRQALEQAFKAIDELVGHLQRGDRIAIIPILGDAQAEASGRIVRFEVPKERQAYDGDLREFRRRLAASLAEMKANAAAHPGSKTDILGSIELAGQEFQSNTRPSHRLLILLSDFIQEDQNLDFRVDKRLAESESVQRFATNLATSASPRLDRVAAYLGLLRSNEFIGLRNPRRIALKQFWIEYFRSVGAEPHFATDGPGLLESAHFWK